MSQSTPEPRNIQRIKLRENIAFYFNEGELRSLCFDLRLDYDDLPGSAKADKARELVSYFERRGRVNDLIKRCRQLRPNVDWGPWWEFRWRLVAKIVGFGVALVAVAVIIRLLIPDGEPPAPIPVTTQPSLPAPSPSPTPAVTSSAAVALRAWHGEYAAVTDSTTLRRLKAIATQVDESSRFTLLCLTNDKVALQFFDRFVSALNGEDNRNWELRAVAPERLAWEEFTLVDPDIRDPLHCVEVLKQLQQGEVRLAFQTSHGKFVTAFGQDQDWVLRAETTVLDRYEKFTAIGLALAPTITLTPTPSPTPSFTPSLTPCVGCTPSPTPTAVVIDTMDSFAGWGKFNDTLGSAINISTTTAGMRNNAMQVDFNLKQGGFVGISKAVAPAVLSGTQGLRFFYTGTGPTDTIELKLLYSPDANGKGEVFSYSQREIAGANGWVPFEQFYSVFDCGLTCRAPGQQLDPSQVWKLEIAVSHQLEGTPGPGRVVLDQIEALR